MTTKPDWLEDRAVSRSGPDLRHSCDNVNRTIADEIADRSVRKTFAVLGVNIDDPVQVERFREDLRFAGSLRRSMESGQSTVFKTAIALAVTAIGAVIWLGLKVKLGLPK